MNILQLLRSAVIYDNYADAVAALTNAGKGRKDGELLVARYTEGGATKTVMGAVYKVDGKAGEVTIFTDSDKLEGDIDTKISEVIDALDKGDTAEAKKFVTAVSEANGIITVSRGEVKSADKTVTIGATVEDGGINLGVNIDNVTLKRNAETGVISVDSAAIKPYKGGNGITVTDDIDAKTIAAKIKSGDKVLSVSEDGIASTLLFAYDSTERKITLQGNSGTAIGEVDCSAFIKDGMLWGEKAFVATETSETVSITKGDITQSHTFTNLTVGHQYLAFCFTDGAVSTAPTYSWDIVDLQNLVDVYTVGNGLQVNASDDHKFEVKRDSTSEGFLTVSADGIKLAGVQTAINNAVTTAIEGLDANVTGSGNNVTVDITEVDGEVKTSVASDVKTSTAYTEVEYNVTGFTGVDKGDTLDAAFNKVDTNVSKLVDEVVANEKVVSQALNVFRQSAGFNESGEYVKPSDTHYIDATDMAGDVVKLDAAIYAVEQSAAAGLTEVEAGDGITVTTKANAKQTVSVKLDNTDGNVLTNGTNGLYLSNIWDCGTYGSTTQE